MRRGYGLVGLLIVMACIVVLFAIAMTALNKAVTGEGSTQLNTVRSLEDQTRLYGIMQGLVIGADDWRGRFLTPSTVHPSGDRSLDTTANFYSALIAYQYATPEMLIAGNEFSGYVEVDHDYDFAVINPREEVFWDPAFQANLADLSNVSYAHLPFYGDRFDDHWEKTFSSTFPLLGNRGPKDGIEDTSSYTYGRNGQWAGHMVFGDGHTEFTDTFTPTWLTIEQDGEVYSDNIFAVEDGANGSDAILSFTSEMARDGPVLQWD